MNINKINRFRNLSPEQIITVKEGVYQHQGHVIYTYPEYTGVTVDMFRYYESIADIKQWHQSVLNGILTQIIEEEKYTLCYVNETLKSLNERIKVLEEQNTKLITIAKVVKLWYKNYDKKTMRYRLYLRAVEALNLIK